MKWFKRNNNVKKRDEHSTYLKVENGRVVPVTGDEPEEHHEDKEAYVFESKEDDSPEEETRGAKWMKWVWLLLIIALGYGTVQLVSGLAFENKEVLKLQEIQRNTLQITEEVPEEKTDETKVEPPADESDLGDSLDEKASDWMSGLKESFTGENDSVELDLPPVADIPEPSGIDYEKRDLLFSIRSLDEKGTMLLEQIRDASVSFIVGDISRGQYLLKLQSVELKLKRYNEEIALVRAESDKHREYDILMEYVLVKKDSLKLLDTELRLATTGSVAQVFNSYVDTHNELTLEADKEFVSQLQKLGYVAEIRNGVIEYR